MYKILTSIVLIFIGALLVLTLRNHKEPLASPTDSQEHSAPFSYWQEFIPTSGKFKVLLPSKPQYIKDLVPAKDQKRLYEIYVSEELNGTAFMISVITHPPEVDMKEGKEILKKMIDEFVAGQSDNELNELKDALQESRHAYNFDIDNDHVKILGKTFVVDQQVYVLSYVTRPEDTNLEEYMHFIDSFVLLPPSPDKESKNK